MNKSNMKQDGALLAKAKSVAFEDAVNGLKSEGLGSLMSSVRTVVQAEGESASPLKLFKQNKSNPLMSVVTPKKS